MAGTIVSSLVMSIVNGVLSDDRNIGPVTIAQAAQGGGNPGTVSVTTSEADITIGLTTPGNYIIENLDDTNSVLYGPKSGGALVNFHKLLPGDWHKGYFDASVVLRAKSSAGTVKIRIRCDEA